jgi:hypothetical protein
MSDAFEIGCVVLFIAVVIAAALLFVVYLTFTY